MPPEIIHIHSYRNNGSPSGSRLLNFARNLGVLFEPGANSRHWGVPFKRQLLCFLMSDLIRRRIPVLEFYRYVSYYVGSTRLLETDFLFENLKHLSACKNYLDVSSPRVVPYFLFRQLPLEHATICNPDVVDLTVTQRSLGHGSNKITYLPVRLEEINKRNKFDLVTSVSVVEHISLGHTLEFMNNILELLVPGGLCILTFPCSRTEIIEYRDSDPYSTQEYDVTNKGYFFQKYFTDKLVEREILFGFDKVVAKKIFGEKEKGQFWKYEEEGTVNPEYSSSKDFKIISNMFSEFNTIKDLPGVGVGCYLLKKAEDESDVQCASGIPTSYELRNVCI